METITEKLKEKNIKPSQQRIKILEYLAAHPCHPTVDHIYSVLHPEMPSLSKSTVYNTLKAFIDAQLVREITIEENEVRYDYNTENHGHFKCEECGTVYDFDIDVFDVDAPNLKNFSITEKNVYFKGICEKCLNNNKI